MSTDQVRQVLQQAADAGAPPPDLEVLHADLMRRRRRRVQYRSTGLAAVAAVAVTAIAFAATAVTTDRRDRGQQAAPTPTAVAPLDVPTGWSDLPPSPLKLRRSALAVTIGDEAIFFGGNQHPLCPPNARCLREGGEDHLDGAAYDVRRGTWTVLASAPVPPIYGSPAVIGDTLYVLQEEGRLLSYDRSEDRWSNLPAAPGDTAHYPHALVAVGSALLAYQRQNDRPDRLYDPASRQWSDVPPDPLSPSFDRQYVSTGSAAVLLAAELTANPGSPGPSLQRAAILDLQDRTWRRLPDAKDTITGSLDWSWDGRRVVSPSRSTADGGEVNGYGRSYSTGGMLDPATGTWSVVPEGPTGRATRSTVGRSSERYKADGDALYDTVAGRWLTVPPAPEEVGTLGSQTWVQDVLVTWGGLADTMTETDSPKAIARGGLYRPAGATTSPGPSAASPRSTATALPALGPGDLSVPWFEVARDASSSSLSITASTGCEKDPLVQVAETADDVTIRVVIPAQVDPFFCGAEALTHQVTLAAPLGSRRLVHGVVNSQ